MARIRSIHPGLFTDEAFVAVSMPARVFLLGVWTEADDQGVFEWNPIKLKMRIMPVDNVDVPAILAELTAANLVKKFDVDGRWLGAIRNFCKYQRPKTPKYRPIKSEEIRNYVASSYRNEETKPDEVGKIPQKVEMTEAEVLQFPPKVEMPPQREEGGDTQEIGPL